MEPLLILAELIPAKPFSQMLSLLSYLFFLWFALFMLSQKSRKPSVIIAGLAILFLAAYVVITILMSSVSLPYDYLKLQKLLWLSAPIPSILWLHLTYILRAEDTRELNKNNSKLILLIFYMALLPFIVAGPSTNLLYEYEVPVPASWPSSKWSFYTILAGPYYYIFCLFLTTSISLAAFNLVISLRRSTYKSEKYNKYKWLLWGTSFFVLGAILLSTIILFNLPLPEPIGHIPLAIGILLVNYSIAKYDALIEGRIIKEKFLSRFWAVFSVLGIFIALYLFMLPKASIIALLVISTFLLIILTFYEKIIELWERIFVDKRIAQVKMQTKQMVSQLIEINPDEIESWLEKVKRLSKAELVILDSIGKGFGRRTSEDVSKELFLSVKTVNTHLKNIRKKLGCRRSSELPLIWLVVNTIKNDPEPTTALVTDIPLTDY